MMMDRLLKYVESAHADLNTANNQLLWAAQTFAAKRKSGDVTKEVVGKLLDDLGMLQLTVRKLEYFATQLVLCDVAQSTAAPLSVKLDLN